MTTKNKTKKYTTQEQYDMKANLWAKAIFPDLEYKEYDWVKDKSDEIYKHIVKKYETITSRHAHVNALAMLIKRYFPTSELIDKYLKLNHNNRQIIDSNTEKQQRDYVPHENIIKMGNDVYQKCILNKKDYKSNMIGLSILLNSLHPPMRNQLYELPIMDNGTNKTKNYSYRDDTGRWHIVINMIQKKKINMNDDVVSEDLSKIIDHSMKLYPRKYLISSWNEPTLQMCEGTISKVLGFMVPSLGVDVFRHSYIVMFYDNKTLYKDRENLARMMLHSVKVADKIYDTFRGKKKITGSKHPPPPPRPVGIQPVLRPVSEKPERPPKPVVVESPIEVEPEVEREYVIVPPRRVKQTEAEAKAKNNEYKRLYRAKNKQLLADKSRAEYYRKKQKKQ